MTGEQTLNVKLPSELLEKFREKAQKKFGYKRGYLKQASIEAILQWIDES